MTLIHLLAALIGAALIYLTVRGDLVLHVEGRAGPLRYLPGYAGAIVLVSAVAGLA